MCMCALYMGSTGRRSGLSRCASLDRRLPMPFFAGPSKPLPPPPGRPPDCPPTQTTQTARYRAPKMGHGCKGTGRHLIAPGVWVGRVILPAFFGVTTNANCSYTTRARSAMLWIAACLFESRRMSTHRHRRHLQLRRLHHCQSATCEAHV